MLLHRTGNRKQNEKTTYGWETIFENDETDKELISKIYKQLIQLNIKKKNPSKNGQNTYIDISPKKTYRWPTGIGTSLINITNY